MPFGSAYRADCLYKERSPCIRRIVLWVLYVRPPVEHNKMPCDPKRKTIHFAKWNETKKKSVYRRHNGSVRCARIHLFISPSITALARSVHCFNLSRLDRMSRERPRVRLRIISYLASHINSFIIIFICVFVWHLNSRIMCTINFAVACRGRRTRCLNKYPYE